MLLHKQILFVVFVVVRIVVVLAVGVGVVEIYLNNYSVYWLQRPLQL